jgi:hypothetical protein
MMRAHIRAASLGLLASLSLTTQALASGDNFTLGCSGSLVVTGASSNTFQCEGDLSLAPTDAALPAFLSDDLSLSLSASGLLSVGVVTLSAPTITLSAARLQVDAGGTLKGQSVTLSATESLVMNGNTDVVGGTVALLAGQPIQRISQQDARAVINWSEINIGREGNVLQLQPRPSGSVVVGSGGSIDLTSGSTPPSVQTSPVPEPASVLLTLSGLLAMAATRKRRGPKPTRKV